MTSEEIQTLEAPELRRRSAIIVNILRENIAVCKRILLEKFQGLYFHRLFFKKIFSLILNFWNILLFRYPMRCSRKIEPKHLCGWIFVGKMSSRRRIVIFYHKTRSSGKAKCKQTAALWAKIRRKKCNFWKTCCFSSSNSYLVFIQIRHS